MKKMILKLSVNMLFCLLSFSEVWLITSNLDENLRVKIWIEDFVYRFYKENVDITIIGLAKWRKDIKKPVSARIK